jgi:transcription-repair coupling factor (superfamily II helicase)
MLEDAVAALKAGLGDEEETAEQWSPTIAIGAPVMIPETYVSDLQLRLALYRRLATFESEEELVTFRAELVDRFGPIPPEIDQLLAVMAIKVLCRRANIEKVEAGPKGIIVSFRDKSFANPAGLVKYVGEQGSFAKVRPDMKVVFLREADDIARRLKTTNRIVKELVAVSEGKAVSALTPPQRAPTPPQPVNPRARVQAYQPRGRR